MPIYEYACEKCAHEFEVEQRITDPPVKSCPRCRGRKVKRLISQTSFVLKGGGWYSDLYSSKKDSGGGKDTGSKDTGGKDSASKDSTGTDSGGKAAGGGDGGSSAGGSDTKKASSGSKGSKGGKGSKAAA